MTGIKPHRVGTFLGPVDTEAEVWYRYEDVVYAPPLNEFDEPCGRGEHVINLYELVVLKHTPKGVWLRTSTGEGRHVCHEWTKKYACRTREEALESFVARKKREKAIHEARAKKAGHFVAMAEKQRGYLLGLDDRRPYVSWL